MNRQVTLLILATALFFVTTPVSAQEKPFTFTHSSFPLTDSVAPAPAVPVPTPVPSAVGDNYLNIQAGFVKDQITEFDDTQNDGPLDAIGHFGSKTGFSFTGAVGRRIYEQVRIEGEYGYNRQGIDEFFVREGIVLPAGPIFPNVSTPATGSFTLQTLMGNLLVDFGSGNTVSPYLGGGLGYLRGKFNHIDIGPDLNRIDDSAGAFGGQIIAGMAFKVNRKLALDVNYRYLGNLTKFDFPNVQRNDRFDYRYDIHKLMFGFRIKI